MDNWVGMHREDGEGKTIKTDKKNLLISSFTYSNIKKSYQ